MTFKMPKRMQCLVRGHDYAPAGLLPKCERCGKPFDIYPSPIAIGIVAMAAALLVVKVKLERVASRIPGETNA